MKKIITILALAICILSLTSCADMTRPIGISGITSGLGSLGSSGGSSGGNWSPTYDVEGVTDIIKADVWEQLFPERWGVGSHWEWTYTTYYSDFYNAATMKYDLYSYENFAKAVNELSYVQIKIEPKENDYKQMYRKDSRDGKGWVHIGSTTSWTQWGDTESELVDFGHFINKPGATDQEKTKELAAFLANISHETGESDYDGNYNYGLFYREEIGYEGRTHIGYRQDDDEYPPSSGKSYHGRGPIQLSYNYNYGPASLVVLGDKSILLDNPEFVMQDGMVAFMTAIWFWMMPQSPKPSCHEVMYSDYDPSSWGFGHTVIVINGGVEGGGAMKARRGIFYEAFSKILLGYTTTEDVYWAGEEKNTDNLTGYW